MKRESHPVDDFFRESLKDIKVTPSPAMRDRFLEEVAQGGGKSWKNLWNSTNIFLLAGLVTLSVILYFLFNLETGKTPGNPEQKTESSFTITNAAPNNQTLKTNNQNKPSSINSTEKNPNTFADVKLVTSNSVNTRRSSHKKNSNDSQSTLPIVRQESTITDLSSQDPNLSEISETSLREKEVAPPLPAEDKNGNNETLVEAELSDPLIPENQTVNPESKPENQPLENNREVPAMTTSGGWTFLPYLLYHLDWNVAQSDNTFIHTLGIQGKLNYERFSLTTGAGISAISGYQRYQVQFNDYLGNYNRLDSITFAWDQNQYYLIPKYHMTETDVWDSTIALDSYRTEKQYRLLRVPVLLGYEFWKKGRFQMEVLSGMEMTAFLGAKTTTDYSYDPGRSKVISIDPDEEQNVRTRFFWMLGLSAEYDITRRFSVSIDPGTRYLLNPQGNNDNTSDPRLNPFIRASFRIKF